MDKPLKIYLGDLTYDTVAISTEAAPLNVGFIASYCLEKFGDKVEITLFKYIADLENADIDIINKFWIDEFKSGTASGKLKIRGTIEKPDAVADLNCKNIVYRDFSLSSLSFHSEMKSE